jgi:tetratricopeptide (TPR) repeat protein
MTTQAATPATEGQVTAYTAELLARLGVGPGASMEEMERAHDLRLDFLAQAPAEMSDWAQQEIGRVDEAYALLTDPHADIPAAAAAALAEAGGSDAAPEASAAPATAAPQAPRMAHSTKVLLLVALAAAVIFGVYKWGGDSGVPAITGQPTDSSSAAATPQLDTAKVGAAMQRISANPKDVAALKELGDLYFQAGDYPTAIEWEKKALEIEPQDVTALLALGAAQFNSGDSEGAKANWKKVVKLDARNAEAHYDLGFLALSVEPVDMATAKAEWQKVVDLDPTSELAKSVSTHLEGLAKQGETASK